MNTGDILGEYEIIGVIGEGGMGKVFKARHRLMDRIVAIKFTRSDYGNNREGNDRFLREIRASARLTHTHVLTAFDAGTAPDGRPYLVTEYLNSVDLASVLQRNAPLPVGDVMGYIVQAAYGIRHAHKQGVIHRDIKPSNLLLDETNNVQLCDFGLARIQNWNRAEERAENPETAGPDEIEAADRPSSTVAQMRPTDSVRTSTGFAQSSADAHAKAATGNRESADKLESIDARAQHALSNAVVDSVVEPFAESGRVAGLTADDNVLQESSLPARGGDEPAAGVDSEVIPLAENDGFDSELTLDEDVAISLTGGRVPVEPPPPSNLPLDGGDGHPAPLSDATLDPPGPPISTRIEGGWDNLQLSASPSPPVRPPVPGFDSFDRLTDAGNIMGTPAYMSPEQCRSARDVDERSDIYSLGCTLYHLLTGKMIYEYRDFGHLIMQQLEGEIPSLADARDDLPGDLDGVFRKMVAKDPAVRYQTMDEVIEALEAVGAKPKVFISYRRIDSLDATDRLFTELLPRFDSDHLFMDVDTIPAGVNFRDHLHKAVSECDVMLVVIGDHWVNARHNDGTRRLDDPADYVRIEIEAALEQNVDVIPVLVGRAQMPAEHEMPESIKAFVYRNAAEVRAGREYRRQVERLANDVSRLWEEKRVRPY